MPLKQWANFCLFNSLKLVLQLEVSKIHILIVCVYFLMDVVNNLGIFFHAFCIQQRIGFRQTHVKFFPPTILATPTIYPHFTKPPFQMQRIKCKEIKTFLNIAPSCLFYTHLVGHQRRPAAMGT